MLKRTFEKLENQNVVSLYTEQNLSLSQIESLIHSDKRTIRDYLILKGVEVKGIKSKVQPTVVGRSELRFNEKIFDKIDTEEKAYWLGFIFADGYISSTGKNFEMTLQARDVGHLHKFNRFMQCNDNNVHYHPKNTPEKIYDLYRWAITNEHLWESLNSLGCVPRKSLILKFPDKRIFSDETLIKHFIRGYFDGDGCVCFTYKSKCISLQGTKEFLEEVSRYIPGNLKVNIYRNQTYQLGTTTHKAVDVLHYLYDDSTIYLTRKYDKSQEFCRYYEES